MLVHIIGVDCATQKEKTAIAFGLWRGNMPKLVEVQSGKDLDSIARKIVEWISGTNTCLLAIDAPLGWPEAFGRVFSKHQAGQFIPIQADELFQRETDRFVRKVYGKKPLEVGAERIARTAHAALNTLDQISKLTNRCISLAWSPLSSDGIHAIEVYPAGTLSAYNLPSKAYKKPDQTDIRGKMIKALSKHIILPENTAIFQDNADCLDAAICVLAGADFLRGSAHPPEDLKLAQKEGWIWIKKT
jgi:predicted RNase H-like nuclease